jgi:hypothetical protein
MHDGYIEILDCDDEVVVVTPAGWILLTFKLKLLNSEFVLRNWNANDDTPCYWTGVQCDYNHTHVTYL